MASKKNLPLKVVIGAVDKITAPLLRIRKKIDSITAPARKLGASLRRLGDASGAKQLSKALGKAFTAAKRLQSAVGSIAKRLLALGAAGAITSFKMVTGFANSGDSAAKFARRIGVGVEWLQEMEYAADRSGISVETLRMSLQRAGRRIGEFVSSGKGEAAGVIQGLGIAARNSSGELRSVEEMLPDILEGLSKIKSENIRNSYAMKLFDTEGVAMVQMLEGGAEAMNKLRAEARELGLVISKEDAAASETFVDKLTNLKGALTGVRNIIGAGLMPILQDLAVRLTQGILDNRKQITEWVRSFAEAVPTFDELRDYARAFKEQLKPLGDFLEWISNTVGIGNAVLASMAAIIGGPLIGALAVLVPAIYSLGAALLLTPVGWIIGGIAAISVAIFALYKNFDKITAAFGRLFEPVFERLYKIQQAISAIIDGAKQLGGRFMRFVGLGDSPAPAPVAQRVAASGGRMAQGQAQAKVTVDFSQLPKGARVSVDPKSDADIDLGMGWSVLGGA